MKQKFIDWSPTLHSRNLIEYCNDVLEEYKAQGYVLTLRQLYYQLVARDIIPNNVKQYNSLGGLVNNARLAGMIDWKQIEDRTRKPESLTHWNDPADIVTAAARTYHKNHWVGQKYYIELWSEKDAISNILQPVCETWDITFMANRGYSSASAMYEASKRFIKELGTGKEIIVLYFGDHDPSGLDMDRDVRQRQALMIFGEENKLLSFENFTRVALTWDQIEEYDPPPNPAKETDSRHESYTLEHGSNGWELDALEPKVLAALAEESIRKYLDEKKYWAVRDEQNIEAAKIAELIKYL